MSERVFTTYRLKPDADPAAFTQWSRDVDQPACRAKDVCLRFDVFLSRDQDGPALVVEDVEVESLKAWEAATSAPDHAEVMQQWDTYADESSVVSVKCDPI